MSSGRDVKQQAAQLSVLRHVAAHPEASTRQIADAVGISNGAVFYVLRALIEKGIVKAENFAQAKQKSRYLYFFTPRGLAEKMRRTDKFIELKREEYRVLRTEVQALENEFDWMIASDRMVDLE